MQLLWTIEPGLHSIGKKINLRWAHNRRNTDEESTRTHNRNSAVKKTACTADKKWELPLKAPTPLHRFWSFFVPNQPSFPYPPPTPPPEGIDQTIWFHPHNWPFSLYLACRCDPSSDMQKPEEKKESKSNKCYSKRNAKMITIDKGFRILFPPLFKRNCYWLYWTAFNTCLAVLACKAENMNVVKSIPPLILFLISDWIDQTIWFLVGWRASSIDPLPRVDALAQPFKQRGDKNNRVQVKYQQIIQSIDMRCGIFDSSLIHS